MRDPERLSCADCPRLEMEAGGAVCALRALPVRLLAETFCANHPSLGGPATRVPVGPVLLRGAEDVDVVAESPDDRSIRDGLIEIVRESGASRVEHMTPREETALWQLRAWKERRAYVLLEGIVGEPRLPGLGTPAAEAAREAAVRAPERPFRPATLRARVAAFVLVLQAVVFLGVLAHNVSSLGLVDRFARGAATAGEALAYDRRAEMLGRVMLTLLLVSAVAFLAWLYRAYANLGALGTPYVAHSPAFAVGCWFIPIASLYYPPAVLQELLDKSGDLDRPPDSGRVWLWWVAFLGGGLAVRLSSVGIGSAPDVSELRQSTWMLIAGNALHVVAAVLAITLVLQITRLQGQRAGSPGILAAFE